MFTYREIMRRIVESGFPERLAATEARRILDHFIRREMMRAPIHFPNGETLYLYRESYHQSPKLEPG